MGYRHLSGHFADRTVDSFFPSEGVVAFQERHLPAEKRNREGILYIGMSPFLMNLCACLIVILINRGLKEHGGDMAIGAYGIVNRVVFLFIMIIMGFNQGCSRLPVITSVPANIRV